MLLFIQQSTLCHTPKEIAVWISNLIHDILCYSPSKPLDCWSSQPADTGSCSQTATLQPGSAATQMWHNLVYCITEGRQHVTACDSTWQDVTACDRMWQHVTGCDSMWQHVTGCDSMWQDVTACDKMWQDVTGCDSMWQDVTACDRMWQDVTGSNCKIDAEQGVIQTLLTERRARLPTAVCLSVHISGKNMDTERDKKKMCLGRPRTKWFG